VGLSIFPFNVGIKVTLSFITESNTMGPVGILISSIGLLVDCMSLP
jgi:hypothetical protein